MSELNQPHVGLSFDMIRQLLKSAVPPCTATVDTPTHYEAVAVNGSHKHLFGYAVAHQDVVTVGFNTEIPEADFKQLASKRLILKMNEHRRLEIRNAKDHDLHQDLQDAFNKMLYYYNEKGWTIN